jgi:hypothetical protein
MFRGFGGCAPSAMASVPIALPERHRRRGAADLLGGDADFERRQAHAAILLGNAEGRHAEIDEAFPDIVRMGFVAVEHAPHHFGGALVGEEFTNLLLEQLLVVGEIEVHDVRP